MHYYAYARKEQQNQPLGDFEPFLIKPLQLLWSKFYSGHVKWEKQPSYNKHFKKQPTKIIMLLQKVVTHHLG